LQQRPVNNGKELHIELIDDIEAKGAFAEVLVSERKRMATFFWQVFFEALDQIFCAIFFYPADVG